MRIAVLGAGGVGGYFGARLAADGNDVTFIARGAHAAAMRERGLKVLSPLGDLHLQPVKLHEDWRTTGLVDIVLVAVKMYDLADAAAIIEPLLAIDTAVVPFQNGVEAQAFLERALGRRYVGGGAAYIATTIEAPGVIRHTGKGARMVFGEPYESQSWRLETLEAACRGAGIDVVLSPAIDVEVWRSSCFWHLSPAPPASGGRRSVPFARIRCCGGVHRHGRRGRGRGAGAGRRLAGGYGSRADRAGAQATDGDEIVDAARPRGRAKTGADWLTGAVVRLGAEAGVATPATAEVYEALAPQRDGPGRAAAS